jgi:Ca-activated chloride channel family protein
MAAQEPEPTTTLTVTTRIVAIDALVRNADGDRILNLDRDAFTLKVDGKPTPIRYFNRDNDLPLTVGLMIDTSGSQRVYFDEEALNAENFFTNTLTNPKDQALVALFDTRVVVLQPMTSRQSQLRNALRRLDYRDTSFQGRTLLFDAIAEVARSVTSTEPGRHALVILTDGDDNGSRASISDAIHQAQLADVAVYSVLYTSEMIGGTQYPASPSVRPSGINVMREISRATGGRAFVVGRGTSISQIFSEIEHDLRSQYRFGFTPLPSKPGKFHSIDLRTTEKRETIQTRSGYYTPN